MLFQLLQAKAINLCYLLAGIDFIAMDMKQKKMTVMGTVDPISVVSKLRKYWSTDLILVGPVKEPEKKEEPKKEEPKKEGEKKEEPKKEGEKKEEGKEGEKKEEKKEEGKKDEEKKEDGKKDDEKKDEGKKKDAAPAPAPVPPPLLVPDPAYLEMVRGGYNRPYYPLMGYNHPQMAYNHPQMAYNTHMGNNSHMAYHPPMASYHVQSMEDNPSTCVIM